MADVFISYSKPDAEYTKALAADLEARGYTTWWDTSLLPGDEFPEEIKRQIDMAKAVIVIWSPSSVKSKWVRAEATRADDQGKLITVYLPGLDPRNIPLPFGTKQMSPLSDNEALIKAIGRMFIPYALTPKRRRNTRLSGWVRLGILGSVIWAFAGY